MNYAKVYKNGTSNAKKLKYIVTGVIGGALTLTISKLIDIYQKEEE